jgi:hypothetical protein
MDPDPGFLKTYDPGGSGFGFGSASLFIRVEKLENYSWGRYKILNLGKRMGGSPVGSFTCIQEAPITGATESPKA